jgi:hypothetical protein
MPKWRDVEKTVIVDLDAIIDCHSVDDFLDYLCELTSEPLLMDICWKPLVDIKIEVTGYVDHEFDDYDAEE